MYKVIINIVMGTIIVFANSFNMNELEKDDNCIVLNDCISCRNLANNYFKHNEVKKAIKYFKYSCINLDDAYSCSELGNITKTKSLAIIYYNKSCLLEGMYGCRSLAYIYLDGWGRINKNIFKGIIFLEKSCKLGAERSCIELADMYHDGKIVKPSQDKEIFFLQQACNLRHYGSCETLAQMYKKLNKNIGALLEYYRKMDNKKETWVGHYWLDDFNLKYININNNTHKSLYSFCKSTGIKESEIRALNPWINKKATNIPPNAEIIIPNIKKEENNESK
jgi:TPR repeat protein